MLNIEQYKSWVLPALLEVPEWVELLDAFFNEIVTLQMYNMGSYNKWGFNGVEEDIDFVDSTKWLIGKDYYKTKCEVDTGGFFSLANGILTFSGSDGSVNNFCVIPYSFVTGRTYRVTFEIYDIVPTNALELEVGIGYENKQLLELSITTDDPYIVSLDLLASDYFFYFKVLQPASLGSFKIRNIKFIGILNSIDEKERILVLRRLLNVDVASRELLERMRDSLSFPSIPNVPEVLLRQIIKGYDEFIGYSGSELASLMFFYFLGYEVDFVYLYARKGDYNSLQYAYVAQKVDDLLESSPGTVYGQVSEGIYASYTIKLKPGHQVIVGDKLSDQTNPFNPILVDVTSINGDYITLSERVTVYADDYIDIYRKYPYAVNPDPDNYMKTSHVDVFFKQKYLVGVDLDFAKLEEFFVRYIPVNVVIRFFGYRNEPEDEFFSLRESAFRIALNKAESIGVTEQLTFPKQDFAYVVWSPAPQTHMDIYGNMVDGYSYVISHVDPLTGEPNYMIVPI